MRLKNKYNFIFKLKYKNLNNIYIYITMLKNQAYRIRQRGGVVPGQVKPEPENLPQVPGGPRPVANKSGFNWADADDYDYDYQRRPQYRAAAASSVPAAASSVPAAASSVPAAPLSAEEKARMKAEKEMRKIVKKIDTLNIRFDSDEDAEEAGIAHDTIDKLEKELRRQMRDYKATYNSDYNGILEYWKDQYDDGNDLGEYRYVNQNRKSLYDREADKYGSNDMRNPMDDFKRSREGIATRRKFNRLIEEEKEKEDNYGFPPLQGGGTKRASKTAPKKGSKRASRKSKKKASRKLSRTKRKSKKSKKSKKSRKSKKASKKRTKKSRK